MIYSHCKESIHLQTISKGKGTKMIKGKAILGATDKRIDCFNACKANNDNCHSCPYKDICEREEYFPNHYDGIDCSDYIPADYTVKGNVFC